MKIIEWVKIYKGLWKKEGDIFKKKYKVSLNNELIPKVDVVSTRLHHDTYKVLRNFKTSQYEIFYVLRKKKAFNTFLFNINYDMIVTDKNGRVIDISINTPAGKISKYYEEAHFVYFAAVGSIKYYKINKNDILKLKVILF